MKISPFIASVVGCAWLLASAPDSSAPVPAEGAEYYSLSAEDAISGMTSSEFSDSTTRKLLINKDSISDLDHTASGHAGRLARRGDK